MTNQPETETLPMALLVQTSPLLDIYTINGKPFTGIAIEHRGNQNNPFDLSKIKTRTTFKQGRKNGPIEWFYKNGQLRSRKNCSINGKLEGLWEEFYENGQLQSRRNYNNGTPQGPFEEFYENGQLRLKGNYNNGKHHGLWEAHHENGKLKYSGYFKGGRKDSVFDYCDENGQHFLSDSNHESFFVSFFQ